MSLASKLKLSVEKPLILLRAAKEDQQLFAGFDCRLRLPKTAVEQLILFAVDRKTLENEFSNILPKLSPEAVFWVAYPKKTSGIESDLLKMESWEFVSETGYVIVSSAAINDTWSGIRIKKKDAAAKYIRDTPMKERQVQGIDYVNRTVKLPKDAVKAMAEFPELEAFFNSMSFTHKREHVEAIEQAKKPETRQRRIDKMIEMVIELRDKKERKKK